MGVAVRQPQCHYQRSVAKRWCLLDISPRDVVDLVGPRMAADIGRRLREIGSAAGFAFGRRGVAGPSTFRTLAIGGTIAALGELIRVWAAAILKRDAR